MKLAVRTATSAVAAVATAGASTLFMGAAPAVAAPGDACGDGTLIAPGVCEQTFTGSGTFIPSSDMTQLEVLLVGAGGSGADQSAPNTNGYAAAGGGGEVKIVDFTSSTDPITVTVPVAGAAGGATDGTTIATVANGTDASANTAGGGASGSGFLGAAGASGSPTPWGAGGGAAASPTSNADGGAGVVVDALAAAGSLFDGDTRCFGGGGAIGAIGVQGIPGCGAGGPADATATVLTAPIANSGGGGGGLTSTQSPEARAGAAGTVIVRWSGATVSVAFASAHGAAPAAQTVVAGAAAVRPADPVADGYVFDGWYTDPAFTTPADFSAVLSASVTYYAKWAPVLAASGMASGTAPLAIGLTTLVAGAGLALFASARRRRES